jgi:hypothetical protein
MRRKLADASDKPTRCAETARADIVLTSPQEGVPLLFIEVDNCHETAEGIADELQKYARFFRRKVKDTDGMERPMWRTRWSAPEGRIGDVRHPPVLLVFNHLGARDLNRTVPRLQERTRPLWAGEWYEDPHVDDPKIPPQSSCSRRPSRRALSL